MTLRECILAAPDGKWRRASWKDRNKKGFSVYGKGYLKRGKTGGLARPDGSLTHINCTSIVADDWEVIKEAPDAK
jgi:hypothetical protein